MKKLSCSFCGCGSPIGYLFDNLELRICLSCRDVTLSYLMSRGVEMRTANPFIAELIHGSRVLESGEHRYYNCWTQKSESVIKL